MNMKPTIAGLAVLAASLFGADVYFGNNARLPELTMPDNELPFSLIEGYQNYKIVATHYRTDKKELRYILANPVAYNAMQRGSTPLPEGSKIVKIGWTVEPMTLYPAALEAREIQRVEYMVKDAARFNHDGDHWGYARFVKKNGDYSPWEQGSKGCIACHSAAKQNDYLFTEFQKTH